MIGKTLHLLILMAIGQPAAAQSGPDLPGWLEFVEEVRVPVDVSGARWLRMDASPSGNIAFISNRKAWLFTRRNASVVPLDAEQCRPGTSMLPMVIRFTPDGEILVSGGPEYFWFNLEGRCVYSHVAKEPLSELMVPLAGRRIVDASGCRRQGCIGAHDFGRLHAAQKLQSGRRRAGTDSVGLPSLEKRVESGRCV